MLVPFVWIGSVPGHKKQAVPGRFRSDPESHLVLIAVLAWCQIGRTDDRRDLIHRRVLLDYA